MKLEDAYERLRKSHENGRLAQGYIINGSVTGNGLELVNRVLMLVFCRSGGAAVCGECPGCRGAVGRRHPDLQWVEPEKKSRIISVEQVRDFQRQLSQTSYVGGWKVCVIRFADRLNPQASNAFLKALEEPAGKTLFLLLTDTPQSLLPTIRSRCQTVTVEGESAMLADEWREPLIGILKRAGTRDAVTVFGLAGELGLLLEGIKARAVEEVEAEAGEADEDVDKEVEDDTLNARAAARYRELRSDLFRYMLLWYRDMLMAVCGADARVMALAEHAGEIGRKAAALDYRRAKGNLDAIEQMFRQLEQNVPESLVLPVGMRLLNG